MVDIPESTNAAPAGQDAERIARITAASDALLSKPYLSDNDRDRVRTITAAALATPSVATPAHDALGDYPMGPMLGVAPVFVRQLMLQAMAAVYAKATGKTLEGMMDAARATWDSDWESDPAPRTIEFAIEAAQSDLQYWDEE